MKIAFWILGASCSGKSYQAKKMSKRLNLPVYHLDLIDDQVNINKLTKKEGYQEILKDLEDVIIVEGLIPFTFTRDMRHVLEILKEYKIVYLFLEPEYSQYKKQLEKRIESYPQGHPYHPVYLNEEEYKTYNENFKKMLKRCLPLKNGTEEITEEDIRSFNYQHDGFTDVKYKQLQISPAGKTVLDLGCSSCTYEKYLMADGALKYTGLDVNKAYLINENAHLFNINNLENWQSPADIVICTSVLHYIKDPEKLIKEAARLSNELFVLEAPLSKEEGKEYILGSRGLYFPTKDLLEHWIFRHFKSYICLGHSIVEDGSYRLIYHCYK